MTIILKRVGRARVPVRPGNTIKDVLMGKTPLITDEGSKYVDNACIVDLHSTYKELIRQENELREKKKKLRWMTYSSFCHLFKFARYLGLVEFTHEEPMIHPPPHGHLYQIGKHDGVHVRISKRRFFKLTDVGIQDERAWTDLCRAYKEGWVLPQKVEYEEPFIRQPLSPEEKITVKPKKPKRREPVELAPGEIPTEIPEEVWAIEPSLSEYKKLVDHLKTLQSIGVEKPEIKIALEELVKSLDPWIVFTLEAKGTSERRKDLEQYWRYKKESDNLYKLYDFVEELNIGNALLMLRTLIKERSRFSEEVLENIVVEEEDESSTDYDVRRLKLSAKQSIDNLRSSIDETKKTTSINKLKKHIDRIDTQLTDNDIIIGLDDLISAIEEYEGITREGLTIEEYKEQKEEAFSEIVEAVDVLDIDDDKLKEIIEQEE